MKNIIKTLMHVFSSSKVSNIVLLSLLFIYFITLIVLHIIWKNDKKKMKIWKYLTFIPLLIPILHLILCVISPAWMIMLLNHIYLYFIPIIIIIWGLFNKKKVIYIILTIFIFVNFLVSVPILHGKIVNYSNMNRKDSYVALLDYLKDNYVLFSWKKLDYEKLKNDGLELIEKSEKENNVDYYYDALANLEKEMHDGHSGLSFYNDNNYTKKKIESYNDYGLSVVRLDDLSYVMVNIDETLKETYSLEEGLRVLKWNGKDMEEASNDAVVPLNVTLKENEDILKPLFASSTGGDEVNIVYIDRKGNKMNLTLHKMDSVVPRCLKTLQIINQDNIEDENFSTKMLTDEIGYLRISSEETDVFHDTLSYITGNHKYAREKLRKNILSLRKNGMKKLIIDVRNNGGGFDEVATALASLFSNKKYYAFSLGKVKDNKYFKQTDRYVYKDGEFSDVEVVVLTNMRCASAGDGLVLYLSKVPNVKVVGLSNPEGINQETGGVVLLPEGAAFTFPTGLVMDKSGVPNIDPSDNRESRNKVDEKIPFTSVAILNLFTYKKDYALDWTIDYLK